MPKIIRTPANTSKKVIESYDTVKKRESFATRYHRGKSLTHRKRGPYDILIRKYQIQADMDLQNILERNRKQIFEVGEEEENENESDLDSDEDERLDSNEMVDTPVLNAHSIVSEFQRRKKTLPQIQKQPERYLKKYRPDELRHFNYDILDTPVSEIPITYALTPNINTTISRSRYHRQP